MAAVELSKLSKTEHDELCCVYASLILHDDKVELSAEKIMKLVKASGNTVEPYWPGLFANALKGRDIGELISNIGSGPAAPVAAVDDKPAEEEKEEEKEPEVEKEEADVGTGGLFGEEDEEEW